MPISLETSTPRTPSAKLLNIGDHVVVAVVDVTQVPWLEYGTQEPKIGKDGKPRTQDVVTGLVISGNAVIKDGDEDRQAQPDELVTIYLAGHNRWEWIEAKRRLPRPLSVGDVMRWKYDRDEKSQVAANPRKVRTVALRPANPDETARVTKCEQLHQQLRSKQIVIDTDPTPAHGVKVSADDMF